MEKRKSGICPSCSRPVGRGGAACPYCGEPLAEAGLFRFRLWMPLAAFMVAVLAVSGLVGFPAGLDDLMPAWLKTLGLTSDPCAENRLADVLRAFALLLLFLPVSRRAPGAPAPIRIRDVVDGILWRVLLFADVALCFATVRYLLTAV